ncbi:dTMP kinase [Candidatus Daviesbacteria bacterium]|nr:dTMP kinase [Candidatus Daviesbacteria bacterium]
MNERGLFVVIEGIDNCGKTTQSMMLTDWFVKQGKTAIQTREPGGTEVGEEIRTILKKSRRQLMHPDTQTLLFYAARNDFMRNVVRPNILNGVNVISDRFDPSTFAYQCYAQGVSTEFVRSLSNYVCTDEEGGWIGPNLTVIIDIPAEESFKRLQNEDNKDQSAIYEEQGVGFMAEVRMGYLQYVQGVSPRSDKLYVPDNTHLIDGMRSKIMIHKEIVGLVEKN